MLWENQEVPGLTCLSEVDLYPWEVSRTLVPSQ